MAYDWSGDAAADRELANELYQRGQREYEQGDYGSAVQSFMACLEYPGNTDESLRDVHYSLASCSARLGAAEDAQAYARSYIEAVGSENAEPYILRLFFHATIGDFSGLW